MRILKPPLSLELLAGAVWLAIGVVALLLPSLVATPPVDGLTALAEIALCAPLCLWFGWLTAHAVATGRWATAGVAVSRVRTAGAFWAYAALSVVIAGAFLAGFVRGALSLVALM